MRLERGRRHGVRASAAGGMGNPVLTSFPTTPVVVDVPIDKAPSELRAFDPEDPGESPSEDPSELALPSKGDLLPPDAVMLVSVGKGKREH